jgi:hypothetical protein
MGSYAALGCCGRIRLLELTFASCGGAGGGGGAEGVERGGKEARATT